MPAFYNLSELQVINVDALIKSHFKEELHPRLPNGQFAKKHSPLAPLIIREDAKKAPRASSKTKAKATTAKKDSEGKKTPKKTARKKSETTLKPEVKKPAAKKTTAKKTEVKKPAAKKPTKTKEAAPKMPPMTVTPTKKRVPRAKVIPIPGVPKPEETAITPDFQNKGRVRVVARRTGSYAVPDMKINNYEDIAQVFADLADADREKAYVVALKDKHIVGIHCVHIGAVSSSIVHPKDMLKTPLLAKADTFYMIHNHPTGNSSPSQEDRDVTERINHVASTLGINLAGHVIIGDNEFTTLDTEGETTGFSNKLDRDSIKREQSAPVYETYQERNKDVSATPIYSKNDLESYIKNNLSLEDSAKGIFIIGADTKNHITHAEPLDVTLPPDELRKKALQSLIMANCTNFFMYTGNANMDTLINAGINQAASHLGTQLLDVIRPNTSDKQDLDSGNFYYKSLAEQGLLNVVKSLYIDLQKSAEKITRIEAKKVHKDLPPGGQWRTMNGHHIYIKDGKVLAGSIPGAKGAKKATKAHVAEHQKTIDKEAKKTPANSASEGHKIPKSRFIKVQEAGKNVGEKIPRKPAEKPKPMTPAEHKKEIDEMTKKPNPKVKQATLEEQKKDAKKMLKKPNSTGKKTSLEEQQKQGREMLAASEDKKSSIADMPTEAKRATDKVVKRKGVNDIRTEKQKNNETAYDVGQKIGGARKDTAAMDKFLNDLSGQSLQSVEEISPEQAQKLCVKKNLLKPVDFEAEFKSSTDINVAMAKQLIYDRIAPKPKDDTPEERVAYLTAMQNIQRSLEPIKTWDEFKQAVYNLGDWMKAETPKNMSDQGRYLEYAQKQYEREPTADDLKKWDSKTSTWKTLTKDEWKKEKLDRVNKVKESIKFAKKVARTPYAPLGEKLTNFFTNYESRDRTITTIAKKKLSWDSYFKQPAEQEKPKRGAIKKQKWEKEMPARIQRIGGRENKVRKPEDMVKTFGFRGIEFGNWVDDTSGNFHLIKCAEAFEDLADILKLSDKDVSLNGKLAIAFGARGKGKALAHYEPAGKAINITKEGGAGTLAHEWGHALDNILYQASTGRASTNYASEGMGEEGDWKVKSRYSELVDAMLKGDGIENITYAGLKGYRYYPKYQKMVQELGLKEAVKQAAEQINKDHESRVNRLQSMTNYYSADTIKKHIDKSERQRKQAISSMAQEMGYHHEKLTGKAPETIPLPTGMSQYYVDSKKQGNTDYWTSTREMFARAFEGYIQGKMTSKFKNDYLVHGALSNHPDAPYPKGEERKRIHAAFDALMDAVRKSNSIQKALEIIGLAEADKAWEDLKKSIAIQAEHVNQHERSAYNVANTEGVLYIPLNRLQTPYQTEKATNFDKVRENVQKMDNGENLDPVIIGFNYEVHDGHHKLEASKIKGYTHAPCVIGEFNDIDKQRLYEEYSELWKSLNHDHGSANFTAQAIVDAYKADDRVKDKGYENGPDVVAKASGDYNRYWAQVWSIGQDWNGFFFMVDSEHDKPRLIAYGDDEDSSILKIVDPVVPKGSKYSHALWQKVCDNWVLKHAKKLIKSFNPEEHPRDGIGRFTTVYHLTQDKDFKYDPNYANTKQEMGAGLYTTPLDDAMYWERALQDEKGNRHPYAIPIDVSEAKLIHRSELPGDRDLAKHLIKHYGSPKEALKNVNAEEATIDGDLLGNDKSTIAQQRLYAKAKGYDGMIMSDDREGNQVLLFNADHIKFNPAITTDELFAMKRKKDFGLTKGIYIDLQKSAGKITRSDAKKVHKDLPEGGVWRTMNGHHVYIKNGKVLAGSVPGMKGAKKATKAQLAEHQANVDKEGKKVAVQKSKKPLYVKAKGADSMAKAEKEDLTEVSKSELQDRINKMEKDAAENARKGLKEARMALMDKKEDLLSMREAIAKQRKSKKRDTELERVDTDLSSIHQEMGKLNNREWEAVQEVRKSPEALEMRRRNEKDTRQQTGELLPEEEKELNEAIKAKPFDPKAPEESFYRLKFDGWDKQAVKGTPVDLGYGEEGFIVSGKKGKEVSVYFGKAGQFLMTVYPNEHDYKSHEDLLHAVANMAKLKVNTIINGYSDGIMGPKPGIGKDKFLSMLTESVTKNGLSPRYELTGEVKKGKGPQAPKPVNPKKEEKNPYHISQKDTEGPNKGKAYYKPIEGGKRVKELDNYGHFFIHGIKGNWTISEARSGLRLTSNASKEIALAEAQDLLERHHKKLEPQLQAHIEKHGESPKTRPTFDDYVKQEVGGNTDHLSADAWGSYRRSYDYKYMGKRD